MQCSRCFTINHGEDLPEGWKLNKKGDKAICEMCVLVITMYKAQEEEK